MRDRQQTAHGAGVPTAGVLNAGKYRHSRGRAEQPQAYRPHPAPQSAGGHHRTFRVREVLAGVRYAVRRRPAAVCGKPFRLRKAVPRPDAEAESGTHRRSGSRHRHRTAQRRRHAPLHRGHGDGNIRLPPTALRSRGRSPLSPLRQTAGVAVRRGDHAAAAGAGPGLQTHPARSGGVRAQGGTPGTAGKAPGRRLRPRPDRRTDGHAGRRERPAGQKPPPRRRSGGRSAPAASTAPGSPIRWKPR